MIRSGLRTLPFLALVAVIAGDASAATTPHHLTGSLHGGLELPDGRAAAKRGGLRYAAQPIGRRSGAPRADAARAIAALRADLGPTWSAWDEETGVPRRLLTAGYATPRAVADPWEAAAIAKRVLADHVDALAPGAAASDFVMVSNVESAGIRSIGFQQQHRGRDVVGGQLSFRFRHDRLVAIGSEALPEVDTPLAPRTIDAATTTDAAVDWIATSVPGTIDRVGSVIGPMVLPILDPDEDRPRYHDVFAVDVRVSSPPSAWTVYVDTATGDRVAREQTLSFAQGTVLYDAPTRSPSFGPRASFPAEGVGLFVDGILQATGPGGIVNFANPTALVGTTLDGPLRTIINAAGEVATQDLFVGDAGSVAWNAVENEVIDAQVSAFVHAGLVKDYVRGIDPTLAYLDAQLQVTVNIGDECNAFSDGDSINFYLSSDSCENTALIADVVYHEFGHSVHRQSLIPGVGAFDGALSEGVSDYLSATMTDDSGLARGFFHSEAPLREIDPPDKEYVWPQDAGEVHAAGRIIAGALWDLRTLLIAKYGETEGIRLTDRIYYEATRRAVDMPSMHAEALLFDDDDGDISNGTPNACEINAAFGSHGLYFAGENYESVTLTPQAGAFRVDVALSVPQFDGCGVSESVSIEYRPRGASEATSMPMEASDGGYTASFPAGPDGEVMQYRVLVNYTVGTVHSLPDNPADPWYEVFVGPSEPLYCTGFDDSDVDEWSLGPGFEIGPIGSADSPVDPPESFDGTRVFGNTLGGDGFYLPFTDASAQSGAIAFDPSGYASIRLQYYRWLTVEDGVFDNASIEVDGEVVWTNLESPDADAATTHHRDREWRFHDIDVTQYATDGEVQLGWTLQTDGGLELGGWAVDALCIVGVRASAAVCGDGILDATEQCDDGNQVEGDGCSSACTPDAGTGGGSGGGGDDEDDDDDDGADGPDGGSLGDAGGLVGRGCGCATRPRWSTGGGLPLLMLPLLLFIRRRG